MSAPFVWWPTPCFCYLGRAPNDGLQWSRHGAFDEPGFWRISVTGFGIDCRAVVDDFGNLVRSWA